MSVMWLLVIIMSERENPSGLNMGAPGIAISSPAFPPFYSEKDCRKVAEWYIHEGKHVFADCIEIQGEPR